ncbi:MAG: hypothetical protein GY778_17505 [bacterium]|nr:hypothetical protein [bacterium]
MAGTKTDPDRVNDRGGIIGGQTDGGTPERYTKRVAEAREFLDLLFGHESLEGKHFGL